MNLLILLTVLLVIIAIAKILKTRELVDTLKDPNSDPISPAEIKTNATGMLVFGIIFFTLVFVTLFTWDKYLLPASASYHGADIDLLMKVTMVLILIVFFITHTLLFWFVFKYYFKKDKKAFWYPHNNRLEMAWTIIPASVLILLITYGMSTWSTVMEPDVEEDALYMEFVSEQFRWTARYAGEDNTLGYASFGLYGKNVLGIATKAAMEERLEESNVNVAKFTQDSINLEQKIADGWNRGKDLSKVKQSLLNYKSNSNRIQYMLNEYNINPAIFDAGEDDIVINANEIYLPKDRQIVLKLRSKDVIHSAYLPHFRAQMNTVPGLQTQFVFKPRYTSEEMKAIAEEEGKNFTGYVLICNKICGSSHYNMKLYINVVEEAEYQQWLSEQTTFKEAFK